MDNAASTVAMLSLVTSPFHAEFYNSIEPSVLDLEELNSYSMQDIVDTVQGDTTLKLMKKILEGIEGLEMSSRSVEYLHKFMHANS